MVLLVFSKFHITGVCISTCLFYLTLCALRSRDTSPRIWELGSSPFLACIWSSCDSKQRLFVMQGWGRAGQSLVYCRVGVCRMRADTEELEVGGKWNTWMDYGKEKSKYNTPRKDLAIFVVFVRNEIFLL